MKTTYFLMFLFVTSMLASCRGTHTAKDPMDSKSEITKNQVKAGDSSTEKAVEMTSGTTGAASNTQTSAKVKNPNREKESIILTDVAQSSGTTGASNNLQMSTGFNSASSSKDFEKLFADLQMTDAQIERFRKAMEDFQMMGGSNKSDGTILSLEDEQNRQMKYILSEAQFKMYQKWNQEND